MKVYQFIIPQPAEISVAILTDRSDPTLIERYRALPDVMERSFDTNETDGLATVLYLRPVVAGDMGLPN